MPASKTTAAVAINARQIYSRAKRRSHSSRLAASAWRFVARGNDIATILLASLAAANAAAFLGPWFTALTGGLAAATTLFASVAHPEQLAANSVHRETQWSGFEAEVSNELTGLDQKSAEDALDILKRLTEREDQIKKGAPPDAW